MAFANSVLDSTKDTLVVTALGGAEQIPFLTLYAVLPASLLFVLAFSVCSSRFTRRVLFNVILVSFLAFYAVFAYALFPNREALAPAALTAHLAAVLPPGLAGAVAMLHNWPFTLFYVASELWGDIVLSLLFWGLANEITAEREAMALYPLFGLGANVAQAVAGRLLRGLATHFAVPASLPPAAAAAAAAAAWNTQLSVIMASVFVAGASILALQAYIAGQAPAWAAARAAAEPPKAPKPLKKRLGTAQTLRLLAGSPQMLCLATMAVCQGLSANLFCVAWKGQLRLLHPDPASYSAFMGDIATVSACFTFGAMLAAPAIFRRLGWAGAAAFTPVCMVVLGWAFFGATIGLGGPAGIPVGMLRPLVLCGAALYIFEKAAKFSLFKPAEEMVYLCVPCSRLAAAPLTRLRRGLSDAARTQGKAAVDVAATQCGKAGGSIFQQGLLVAFGGLGGALPALAVAHTLCVSLWIAAVSSLGHYHGHLLGRLHAKPRRVEPYTVGPACDLLDAQSYKAAAELDKPAPVLPAL